MIGATQALDRAREYVRPIAWRGKTPDPEDLDGSLIFARDRSVESFDGTTIAYTVRGKRGPWVALVPGFSCPDNFWKYVVPELERDHRVIVWDLRGLGASGTPSSPGYRATKLSPVHFTIDNYVRDLEAILDAEKADRVALIGHSMGGQIIFEAYHQWPERVSAIVSLTAPYESPVRTFYGRDFTGFLHGVNLAFNLIPRPAIVLWRAIFLAKPALTHKIAQLTQALGPKAKKEDMVPYYRHMAFLDPLVMLKMAEAMRAHSAADVLQTVEVPTLIVAGTADRFSPIELARHMAETIPNAELVEIEGARHAAIIEKPKEVNAALMSFLDQHVGRVASRGATRKSSRATRG